jgi:hypothetical protein
MYFIKENKNIKSAIFQGIFLELLWDFLIPLYCLESMLILPIEKELKQ